ncbi:hypothetical protein ACOSQ3_023603 [Xanthoceras sorbifolium]
MHGASPLAIDEIVHWFIKHYHEFISANSVAASRMITASSVTRWTAPTYNCFKINTDATISEQLGITGLGIIIRDHNGVVLAFSAQRLGSAFLVVSAEAIGVYCG